MLILNDLYVLDLEDILSRLCQSPLRYLIIKCFTSFNFQTGTLTEGKPTVSAVASFVYEEPEVLRIAAAVEKTAVHPIANAIISKAESLNLNIPTTQGQLAEPGFGSLAEVEGQLVAVGSLEWVHDRFQQRKNLSDLLNLEQSVKQKSSKGSSPSNNSQTVVYVGKEGEGVIGAIAISDNLRQDAESTINRYYPLQF